jgi:hypothetical protein
VAVPSAVERVAAGAAAVGLVASVARQLRLALSWRGTLMRTPTVDGSP